MDPEHSAAEQRAHVVCMIYAKHCARIESLIDLEHELGPDVVPVQEMRDQVGLLSIFGVDDVRSIPVVRRLVLRSIVREYTNNPCLSDDEAVDDVAKFTGTEGLEKLGGT